MEGYRAGQKDRGIEKEEGGEGRGGRRGVCSGEAMLEVD